MKKTLFIILSVVAILLFSGCTSIHITNLEHIEPEFKNPTKVVYGTNRTNYDDVNQEYKDPVEYEIPENSIKSVIKKLFSLSYKKLDGKIDKSATKDYVVLHDKDKKTVTIKLDILEVDGIYYEPIKLDIFIDYLMQVVTPKGGKFYTIQEAYDQGLLTLENLNLLHKYHEQVQIQLELDSIFEGAIKKTRLEELINDFPNATLENINIDKYYGKYQSAYAVKMSVTFYIYGGISSETIEGLEFVFNGPATLIWHESK